MPSLLVPYLTSSFCYGATKQTGSTLTTSQHDLFDPSTKSKDKNNKQYSHTQDTEQVSCMHGGLVF